MAHSSDRGAESQNAPGALCKAPFVNLDFDPHGEVNACCANILFPLGDVRSMTLDEIWNGERVALLRSALSAGDLSLGCSVCAHRLQHGGAERPFETYSGFEMPVTEDQMPARMTFSLSSACNLECVMCGPNRSSLIRRNRTDLGPAHNPYGEDFHRQLEPYLDACKFVDFAGGEPFLIRGHHRIWDYLIANRLSPRCGITTNATIWNDRVEQVLDHFHTDVGVSIDGTSADVLESVRVGTKHTVVFENLERFRRHAMAKGTQVSINFTFLSHNWFELQEMLLFGEELGIRVNVMTVIDPDHGLQRMPDDELRMVHRTLTRQSDHLLPQLTLNADQWRRQLAMVDAEIERRADRVPFHPVMEPPSERNEDLVIDSIIRWARDRPALSPEELLIARRECLRHLSIWNETRSHERTHAIGTISLTLDGKVLVLHLGSVMNPPPPECVASLGDVLTAAKRQFGESMWIAEERDEGATLYHTLFLGGEAARADKDGTIIRFATLRTTGGIEVFVARDDRFVRSESRPPTPVSIRMSSLQQ